MDSTTAAHSYIDYENRRVQAANGTTYAYRDLGSGELPLILLQHFRGNLDNWDPAFIDALAEKRRVVTFDSDPMILPHYSHLLAGLIPQAKVKIYPDSAHGFLFQYATEFAADVEAFLDGDS